MGRKVAPISAGDLDKSTMNNVEASRDSAVLPVELPAVGDVGTDAEAPIL